MSDVNMNAIPRTPAMLRPFELDLDQLRTRLDEMVDVTIGDLVSEFLLMPKGDSFIAYTTFRDAYEVLKRCTRAFHDFTADSVYAALRENSRVLGVLRAILGMTPPEWAELARTELQSHITQGSARSLDRTCRAESDYFARLELRHRQRLNRAGTTLIETAKGLERIRALVQVAVRYINEGAPIESQGLIHRLAKFDTEHGMQSLRHVSAENVPYAVLLYERYLGRPFAGHRDAVSELVGEIMESAVETRLRAAGVSYRKTNRAEHLPGFDQAPDFCIPDESSPVVVIEAKITSDDGTARDKYARIKELESQRNRHVAAGRPSYEVVACIDGRGFRQRREDMRQILTRLDGKVFTGATLDALLTHTRIREYVALPSD